MVKVLAFGFAGLVVVLIVVAMVSFVWNVWHAEEDLPSVGAGADSGAGLRAKAEQLEARARARRLELQRGDCSIYLRDDCEEKRRLIERDETQAAALRLRASQAGRP